MASKARKRNYVPPGQPPLPGFAGYEPSSPLETETVYRGAQPYQQDAQTETQQPQGPVQNTDLESLLREPNVMAFRNKAKSLMNYPSEDIRSFLQHYFPGQFVNRQPIRDYTVMQLRTALNGVCETYFRELDFLAEAVYYSLEDSARELATEEKEGLMRQYLPKKICRRINEISEREKPIDIGELFREQVIKYGNLIKDKIKYKDPLKK